MRLAARALLCLTLAGGCTATPSPLAPGRRGSIGLPHLGVLTDSAELPVSGEGYRRYRRLGQAHFAVPRLVSGLEQVAARVAREAPGGPLLIGDLSGRGGGQIPRHVSHRTGRDVDLLFFQTTTQGMELPTFGFPIFGTDGLALFHPSGIYAQFDVVRNHALVVALLEEPSFHVQWIFISRWLSRQLLEYGLASGDTPDLLIRMHTVFRQPADSAPHDDHFHVRIACTPEEEVGGCVAGARWPWHPAPLTFSGSSPVDDEPLPAQSAPSPAPVPLPPLPPRDPATPIAWLGAPTSTFFAWRIDAPRR